ncbi:MAG TPA: trigger factor [Longimicrobiales bacterium]|nr:trigger factor [Longimicrobiales bacterium]
MSELQVEIHNHGSWGRHLTITVPADRLESERSNAARRLAQKVRLPGFRKGKVPAQVLQKKFGGAVEQEMLEKVMGAAYREVIEREGLQPISQAAIENVDYKPGEDLKFDVHFEVRPEIELNRLGGFTVRRPPSAVDDAAVAAVLQRLREEHASWQPIEAGQALVNGDMAVVEITALEGASAHQTRRYQVYLGQEQVRPEIEDAIRTLAPGEQGEFTIDLPEGEAENTLKPHRIKIDLIEAKHPEYPELTDEFAQGLGAFESVADLRARVRDDLEKEAVAEAERAVRQDLVSQIVEANPFDVPDSMVNQYLDQMIRPRKGEEPARMEEFKQAAYPGAQQALRRMLVIDRVADLESLRATPTEVEAKIEEIGGRVGKPGHELYAQFQKSGRLGEIEESITEEKVFEYLKSLSTIE